MITEGTLIGGRYRLDQAIGRGRGGIVWLAFDLRLNRTVAIKPMLAHKNGDSARLDQSRSIALAQAHQASKIADGNVIRVLGAVEDNHHPWLVMEYVPSRNMADFLDEHGPLTPQQAAFLGIQLASGLRAIHSLGLRHGSVQPGNVLLADDGGVRLTDAVISDPEVAKGYLSPEVRKGHRDDPQSDVFSLGATLYTAVEGVPPFGEHGDQGLRPPENAGPLRGALLKLLREQPSSRPTLVDTISALKAITQGKQAAFIPPTAPSMRPPYLPQPLQPPVKAARAPMDIVRSSPKVRMWILTILAVVTVSAIGFGIIEVVF